MSTDPSGAAPPTPRPLSGLRIGILGKGGTGKSTLTVLLAREMARKGYRVCLLDADSTNLGLSRALGLEQEPSPLLEYFGGMVFSGGPVSCPVDDPSLLQGARLNVGSLPAPHLGQSKEGVTLLSAGKIGAMGPGAGCDGPVAKIARDLSLEGMGENVVTLLDLKAGLEDMARGVLATLDLALVVVDPTVAAIRVAADLRKMVADLMAGAPPATRHLEDPELEELALALFRKARVRGVGIVLNRVPDVNTEVRLAGKVMREAELKPLGALREDPTIGSAWLEGSSLSSHENQSRLNAVLEGLEALARPRDQADSLSS